MNKNVLIAFGGAILIAILVAVMMSAMLKGGKQEKVAESTTPPVQILVAKAPLSTGEALSTMNVAWKTWPADMAFPDTIIRKGTEKLSEVAKGRALRPIAMDQPVLSSAIVSGEGGFMAAKLSPGMRAAAVNTKAITLAGGFINPGDYVDVVLTYSMRMRASSDDDALQQQMDRAIGLNLDRYASETVLRNVKVLGIDQRAGSEPPKETGGKEKTSAAPKVGKTATLEVDEQGAEILALAERMGDITLVLRPLGDDDTADDGKPTISDARLVKMNKELYAELSRIEAEGSSQSNNIRIYSGGGVINIPTR